MRFNKIHDRRKSKHKKRLAEINFIKNEPFTQRHYNQKDFIIYGSIIVRFARGNVLIRSGANDYESEVVIGFTSGGNMLLYNVVDFTPTMEKKSRIASNQHYRK